MTPALTRHPDDWYLHVAVTWSPRYTLADLAVVLASIASQLEEPRALDPLRSGRHLLRARVFPRDGGSGADAWSEAWITAAAVDDAATAPRPRVVLSFRLHGADPGRWAARVLAGCVDRIRRGTSLGPHEVLPAGDRLLLWDPRDLRGEAHGDYLGKVGSMIFEAADPGRERMLITPDMVRAIQREAVRLGVPDVVVACEAASSSDPMGILACLGHVDCWRATEVSYLSLDQIRDLTSAAICADDWHAAAVLRRAAAPDEHGWIPRPDELAARGAALAAWNARAARLRDEALRISPWLASPADDRA